jgi:hypothetical protein
MSSEGYNPYAPPATEVVPEATDSGLRHRSVLVMVLLFVVTLGLYYPLWFLRRRPGLNRLGSRQLPLWPLATFAIFFFVRVALALLEGERPPQEVWGDEVATILSVLELTLSVMMIFQCFAIKDIIEDYVHGSDDEGGMFRPHAKLSGVMTFFFSIFYLQYAINKYVVGARR